MSVCHERPLLHDNAKKGRTAAHDGRCDVALEMRLVGTSDRRERVGNTREARGIVPDRPPRTPSRCGLKASRPRTHLAASSLTAPIPLSWSARRWSGVGDEQKTSTPCRSRAGRAWRRLENEKNQPASGGRLRSSLSCWWLYQLKPVARVRRRQLSTTKP